MKKFSKSAKKFIRTEKARIRRENLFSNDQQEQINKLLLGVLGENKTKEKKPIKKLKNKKG